MANCQCGNDSCEHQQFDYELCCICSKFIGWCYACLRKAGEMWFWENDL